MPAPRKTKAEKAADTLASHVCSRALAESGAVINILDTVKVHRVAYEAALAGPPDAEARARVAVDAWIAVNRTNKPTTDLRPSTIHYRTHMVERDGTEFTSPVGFEAGETGNRTADAHVAQACIAGHLKGTYYWCTEEGTGRFLNGIGPDGNWITCSRTSTAPAYISGRLSPVYFPAVRIYNPHPRLTYRRIRGSSETLVAYDTRDASLGPEPVGWVLGEDVPTGSVVS